MLAVLESDDLQLPAIEALITTDEEIGLLGAAALNGTELKGRTLLNMDSEEEGILTVSVRRRYDSMMDLPVRRSEVMGEQMEVTIFRSCRWPFRYGNPQKPCQLQHSGGPFPVRTGRKDGLLP